MDERKAKEICQKINSHFPRVPSFKVECDENHGFYPVAYVDEISDRDMEQIMECLDEDRNWLIMPHDKDYIEISLG